MGTPASQKLESANKVPWALALAGFLPFLSLSVFLLVIGSKHELFGAVFDIFKVWSAIILSFLGGIRWGIAISSRALNNTVLSLSVVPSIVGWLSLLLPDQLCLLVLLLCYCAQGAWDSLSLRTHTGLAWFARLRIVLTFLVVGAHLLALFAFLAR